MKMKIVITIVAMLAIACLPGLSAVINTEEFVLNTMSPDAGVPLKSAGMATAFVCEQQFVLNLLEADAPVGNTQVVDVSLIVSASFALDSLVADLNAVRPQTGEVSFTVFLDFSLSLIDPDSEVTAPIAGDEQVSVFATFALNTASPDAVAPPVGATDTDKTVLTAHLTAFSTMEQTQFVLHSAYLSFTLRTPLAIPGAQNPLRIASFGLLDGNAVISWESEPGSLYYLHQSENFEDLTSGGTSDTESISVESIGNRIIFETKTPPEAVSVFYRISTPE